MTVIDTVTADTLDVGDVIEYVRKAHTRTLTVLKVEDTGDEIRVRAYSHDKGDNVTVVFQPDDYVDIIGS